MNGITGGSTATSGVQGGNTSAITNPNTQIQITTKRTESTG